MEQLEQIITPLITAIKKLDEEHKGLHELSDAFLRYLCVKEIGQKVADGIGCPEENLSRLARDIIIVKTEEKARNTSSIVLVSATEQFLGAIEPPWIISAEPSEELHKQEKTPLLLPKANNELVMFNRQESDTVSVQVPVTENALPDVSARFGILQKQVQDRVLRIRDSLDNTNALQFIDQLTQHLSEVASTTSKTRIGFYGRRGAGKTTLLNRLLGGSLLPTGPNSAVTAAITEIVGWDKNEFMAIIFAIDMNEWKNSVSTARQEISNLREQGDKQLGPSAQALQDQLTALWGEEHELLRGDLENGYKWEQVSLEEDLLPSEYIPIVAKGFAVKTAKSLDLLKEELDQFTDRRKDKSAWPLVFKITVFGPFDLLCKGSFSLVDIPGNGDEDYTLGRRFAEGRAMCDRLYYLPDPVTLFTQQTANNCANLDTYLCSDFGVIVCHLHQQVKKDGWPTDYPEAHFRKGLNKYFDGDDKRDLFKSTKVFCLENEKQSPAYSTLYEAFIQSEFLNDDSKVAVPLQRFINEVNLGFAVLQSTLNLDSDSLKTLERIFKTYDEQSAPPLEVIVKWRATLLRTEQQLKGKSLLDQQTLHYATLRHLLQNGGSPALARSIVDKVVNWIQLKSLEEALLQISDELRTNARTMLKKGLQQLPNSEDLLEKTLAAVNSWVPPLQSFCANAIEFAQHRIKRFCESDLPSFVRTGTGCRDTMTNLIECWWKEKQNVFADEACNAIVSFAQDQAREINSAIKQWLTVTLAQLTNIKLARRDELLPLLTFISEDPSQNELTVKAIKSVSIGSEEYLSLISRYPDILSYPDCQWLPPRPKEGVVYVISTRTQHDGRYKILESEQPPTARALKLSAKGINIPKVLRMWKVRRTSAVMKVIHALLQKVEVKNYPSTFDAPLALIEEVGDRVSKIIE